MGSPEWTVFITFDIDLRGLLWVYYHGHGGVKGYDRADRLADKATRFTSALRVDVLRSLRHYLRARRDEHHTIDRLQQTGVERRSARDDLPLNSSDTDVVVVILLRTAVETAIA